MKVKGFWVLFRFIPVLSWSFSAIVLGLSIVVGHLSWSVIRFRDLFLIILSAALLQGLIAHAYNDLIDWKSGTDKYSPGILSGGSRVIPKQLIRENELTSIALWSIMAVLVIALYFIYVIGYEILIFLVVGLWAAVAYSCSPLKLAYRPWLGEWLCAWPAMLICTVGTSYVLSRGRLYGESILFGMIHATFSITWLMLHHIPDIDADLRAKPPKLTTIAYIKFKSGWKGVVRVIEGYLTLTLLMSIIGGVFLHRSDITLISGFLVIMVLYIIHKTRLEQVEAVTRTEILTIVITIVNAVGLSWTFLK